MKTQFGGDPKKRKTDDQKKRESLKQNVKSAKKRRDNVWDSTSLAPLQKATKAFYDAKQEKRAGKKALRQKVKDARSEMKKQEEKAFNTWDRDYARANEQVDKARAERRAFRKSKKSR